MLRESFSFQVNNTPEEVFTLLLKELGLQEKKMKPRFKKQEQLLVPYDTKGKR